MKKFDMHNFDNHHSQRAASYNAAIDQGLRQYMLNVYNIMGAGLAFTALTAYLVSFMATSAHPMVNGPVAMLKNGRFLTELGLALYSSPLSFVIMLAPLALVFFLSFRITSMQVSTARTLFLVYAGLVGLSLSSLFLIYTSASITQSFLVTAASFGCLSLYGYMTSRDLTPIGNFLIMALFGVIIASLVNLFLKSAGLDYALSLLSVLLFSGLTAYDTQKIKELYYEDDDADTAGRKSIMGALTLYLDFLNLFLALLRVFNITRDE